MRDDVTVKVDLEAEDTLAVRLNSLRVEGPRRDGVAVRDVLQRQTRAILKEADSFDGGLALIEVDGVSNAVLMRSAKPEGKRFVQIILRDGTSIVVEAHGGAIHLEREKYERLTETLVDLI